MFILRMFLFNLKGPDRSQCQWRRLLGAAAGSVGYDQWLRYRNSSLRQQKLKEEIETLKKNQERLEKNIQRYQDKAWEIRQERNQLKQQLQQQPL